MGRRKQEKIIQISLVIATLVMTILRFLLNEKGRVNPDSIRFMRTSNVFPVIDNTTTPLGYPLSLKLFTVFGLDEFWASKTVGILALLAILFFARKKQFYFRETVAAVGLFSLVSIFSYTMSEALILPFVFIFLYVGRQIIIDELKGIKAVFLLSLMLIILYNIRYPALFFMGAVFAFGLLNYKKHYSKTFIISGISGFIFVVLYKFLFIDYFNENYVDQFLNVGLHPTSKLITEFFQGIFTAFNPFIHIANPAGGFVNTGIYGIGLLNILLIIYMIIKAGISETEKFLIFTGVTGIICSFFIQYFYSVNALDYRLLIPFTFPVWLVYFRKMFLFLVRFTYGITVLSLLTGFIFTWLARGNYLENRKEANRFLTEENLKEVPLKFYLESEKELDKTQIAELLSTVNPNISITFKASDTLQKTTLTANKVLTKIKIDTNKFQ